MLTKKKMARGKVRVTFSMPALAGVEKLEMAGDFNNWDPSATPLTPAKDGGWSVALTLEGGRRYQYRYLADGKTWHNDWAADAYAPNEHGSDNSVVDLTEAGLPAPEKKKPAARKAKAKA